MPSNSPTELGLAGHEMQRSIKKKLSLLLPRKAAEGEFGALQKTTEEGPCKGFSTTAPSPYLSPTDNHLLLRGMQVTQPVVLS